MATLKEYAITKFCSAIEAAPKMYMPYGFDIILHDNFIIFCM